MHTENYGWTAAVPGSSDYITPAIIDIAKAVGAKTVLDAGCGNGALCGALAELELDVTGVDADRQGVELAAKNFPKAKFSCAAFEDMPPRTDFDLVVSTEVVEHLYSPGELISYAFRALRPGGTFAISTPYHGYLKNLALSVAGKWDKHHTVLWEGGHIKFWSYATLSELLARGQFGRSRFVGVGRLPGLWKSMILVTEKPR